MAGGEDGAGAGHAEAVGVERGAGGYRCREGRVWGWPEGAAEMADIATHKDEGVGAGAC